MVIKDIELSVLKKIEQLKTLNALKDNFYSDLSQVERIECELTAFCKQLRAMPLGTVSQELLTHKEFIAYVEQRYDRSLKYWMLVESYLDAARMEDCEQARKRLALLASTITDAMTDVVGREYAFDGRVLLDRQALSYVLFA